MGAKGVRIASSQEELNTFTKCLLKDVQALERMIRKGWFETEPMRIGAEQEICLIDEHGKPAPYNMELLRRLNHESFTTELARFNIEANLKPLEFTGSCFSDMESQIDELLALLSKTADEVGISYILTGILPSIRKFDVDIHNLTPIDRYFALIDAINKLRGELYELKIAGLDELNIRHTSALIEACNTSFQVHLQVTPDDFVEKYNAAQATAAAVMAISTNSPMLFGKRLWYETRIALFQQSVDTRVTGEHLRYTSPRVTFGSDWVKHSILDLYKEDIVRYKSLLITDVDDDVFEIMAAGKTPKLRALSIHNSTVYRWNRPCYGISPNGKPHLRIENRLFASGPSVVDEVANSAFWIGIMNGFCDVYGDISKKMDFDDAKSNFVKACRGGLGSKFRWVDGKIVNDVELIQKELIPIAREGLKKAKVNEADIDKYLGIIEERAESGMNGARWTLESYAKLKKNASREETVTALIASMAQRQSTGQPVHTWKLASTEDLADWSPSTMLVEEFMTTDLFTLDPTDIPELAADVIDWQRIRYLPIEDAEGRLIGLLTSRGLLRYFSNRSKNTLKGTKLVKDLMIKNPTTVAPEATITEAMELMRSNDIGCLPVVNAGKLVGIITEANFLNVTSSLVKRLKARTRSQNLSFDGLMEAPTGEEPAAAQENGQQQTAPAQEGEA